MLVSWNDHFALGIDIIDSGHALVIEAINQLNEATTSAESERVARHMLPLLQRQLDSQFAAEGHLLAQLPATTERARHETEHRQLLSALDAIGRAQSEGAESAGILLLNLVCFLVSHLRATDGDTYAASRFRAAA